MLERAKLRPYRTKNNLEHLMDIYADDLSIYLKYDKKNKNLEPEPNFALWRFEAECLDCVWSP